MSDQRTADREMFDPDEPADRGRGARGPVLVTGAAGFIGFHLSRRLLERGDAVVGVDNLNDYYDVGLKEARRDLLADHPAFDFVRGDLADRDAVATLYRERAPHRVVHLAAQAGVRYSLDNPHAYVDSNLVAFVNVLEGCRHAGVDHLVFASSSSVYGTDAQVPFSTAERADRPVSLYAATKRSNELMAYTYAHLYGLPATGLRFFTVYGPWGRPDMAYYSFTAAIDRGETIQVFNHGRMKRDFTYVDDVVDGVVAALDRPPPTDDPTDDPTDTASFDTSPFRLYNLGNSEPVELLDFIEIIETSLGRSARKEMLPMQPGDVPRTFADISAARRDLGFDPATPLEEGMRRFTEWYRSYHGPRG